MGDAESLLGAAGRGQREMVASLLQRGISVDARGEHGCTALMAAAGQGHTDTVDALAGTHNANVEGITGKGWTALMWAASHGHTDTANPLAGTHNTNVEAVDRKDLTALKIAGEGGHADAVNALIRHGATWY